MLKKVRLALWALAIGVMLSACSSDAEISPTPPQDVDAAVRTAIAEALPTSTPTPEPDINASVQAAIQATIAAQPTPTLMPAPTPAPTPVPVTAPTPIATPTSQPTGGLRPIHQWTSENPATKEEIEAELQKHRGSSLVFSSWGGAYQDAQRRAYAIPFTAQFGIQIIDVQRPLIENVRAMSQSGDVTWDVFDQGPDSISELAKTGDLEELDFSIIDNRHLFDIVKSPYIGGGGNTWSEVWAYNTDVFPEDNQPHTMADIYDPGRFPGRRAWAYFPDHEMIFVLLSKNPELLDSPEGRASLSALTDEQVDRAFDIFEEYHDQVGSFWQTGAECPDALSRGEVDLCTAWSSRIFDAVEAGRPIRICWECGHVLNTDVWGIVKGLKAQDPAAFELAQLYMAWTALPENNARMAQFIAYGPINTLSLPYLAGREYDHVRDDLSSSSSNLPYAIFKDEVHAEQHPTHGWTAGTHFSSLFSSHSLPKSHSLSIGGKLSGYALPSCISEKAGLPQCNATGDAAHLSSSYIFYAWYTPNIISFYP